MKGRLSYTLLIVACIDIINQQKVTAKNDPTDLLKRIDKQHGTHTIDHAAQIGLGSKKYELINLEIWIYNLGDGK